MLFKELSKQISAIFSQLMTRLGIGLLWLLHLLPSSVLGRVGEGIGYVIYYLAGKRRRIGEKNLALCFPAWSEKQRNQVLHRHFQVLSRAALEHGILFWSSHQRAGKLVQVEGWEHFEAIQNEPVILLAPHFVGLDMGGVPLLLKHYKLVSMYSRLKNPLFDALMLKARHRFGEHTLISRHEGVRPLIREIKRGAALYYLPDQDFGAKDAEFAPFFGVPAATINALPRLAKVSHANILPAVTRQLPNGLGYVLKFYPAWDNFPSDNMLADITRMNAFIEERVLEMPEQYFWLHKRFKTRPLGETSVYK
ncbi:lysophospholipid acyltransferase family protein [Sulfuriferula nivalis]|uniref:Lauroyl acyltransferase n=1 Tax=Sulfuriferula nivalis TaxID=2675298 RepID=A0A809S6U3_9PROT|nr:lysophospholipid acyltransferase family protein [Sulfuriferula nivalis]BBO99322.1 lauroyl acyltransferase [Sulfuriferula nivalis]